jgi:GPH family glycoside/pentoside/hexuronide:cation symporter
MTTESEKLPQRTKWLYGSADLGFALSDTILGVLFAIFLTDVVGLAPKLAAAAIFFGRTWDWINDPLIGHLSDRTRSRWGRRRPYLLFGWLPFALTFAALWQRPPFTSDLALVIYYALAYFCYDTALTFVSMPYFALTPELTLDYDERTSLTTYRMVFSILGGLAGFTLPLMLIGAMRPENAGRVSAMGIGFGLFCALPLLLAFLGTRERPEYQAQPQRSVRDSIRAAARNRPFIFVMGLFLFTWTGIEIVQAMLLYFLKYRMNLEAESDIILGTIFVVALLMLPFWAWLSRRTDKRVAYIGGMIFLAAVIVSLAFLSPGLGLPVVLALAALAGVGVSAVHVLPWAMIPDAVEVDELATGARHEGVFYSLVSLFKKIASSIAIPLTLLALDQSGYVSNATQQPASAVRTIQWLTGPLPAACLGAGILFALVYPLSRERHGEIRAEIAARRKIGF